MAMPVSVKALMIGTMRKISEATSMLDAKAPPREARPLHRAFTLANASSVLWAMPMRVTWLSGFNPPKFFSFLIASLDDDRLDEVEETASDGATTAAMEEEVMVAAIAERFNKQSCKAAKREQANV